MPKKPSKRYREALKVVDATKSYPLASAVEILNKFPKAKFNESVEVAFHLGVDPKQSDQMVRGTVPLPHGSGKTVRVLVFARPGPSADAAKAAGAEFVGFDDMIKKAGGRTTVPQIFIGNVHVGGFDDMKALDTQGKLEALLFPNGK